MIRANLCSNALADEQANGHRDIADQHIGQSKVCMPMGRRNRAFFNNTVIGDTLMDDFVLAGNGGKADVFGIFQECNRFFQKRGTPTVAIIMDSNIIALATGKGMIDSGFPADTVRIMFDGKAVLQCRAIHFDQPFYRFRIAAIIDQKQMPMRAGLRQHTCQCPRQ